MVGFVDNNSSGEHPSDDRSCVERVHDAVVQVPEFVSQRLRHYRAMGEFAVTFGWPVLQRKIVARAESALGRSGGEAADEPAIEWPTREDVIRADESTPEPARAPEAEAEPAPAPNVVELATTRAATHGASNGAGNTNGNGNGAKPVSELAIPGYDSLSASQVVERLDGLPSHDLDEVRDYEASHRNRRTILGKIDQLRA